MNEFKMPQQHTVEIYLKKSIFCGLPKYGLLQQQPKKKKKERKKRKKEKKEEEIKLWVSFKKFFFKYVINVDNTSPSSYVSVKALMINLSHISVNILHLETLEHKSLTRNFQVQS